MIGKSEEYQGNKRRIEVQILLASGQKIQGDVVVTGQRTFGQYLNSGPDFLEFIMMDGTTTWFARHQILQVWEHSIPQAEQLKEAQKSKHDFDPFEILGVAQDADMKTIHRAYVSLARAYHPDRFSAVGLPAEIQSYVQDMSKRINAAYTELEYKTKTQTAQSA